MQERIEHFDNFLSKLESRKKSIEEKLNLKNKSGYKFYKESQPLITLPAMNDLIEHLKKYKKTTLALIDNEQNIAFYELHLETVVNLLNNISQKSIHFNKKELQQLLPEDFHFILPKNVPYFKTMSDIASDVGQIVLFSTGLVAACFGLAGFVTGIVVGFLTLGAGLGPVGASGILALTAFSTLASAFAGAVMGVFLGLIASALIVPLLEEPLNNAYLSNHLTDNTKAFDSNLLKEAFIELSKHLKYDVSANDETIELDSTIINSGKSFL
ncbi:MAG: hypothetical protein H0U70_04395 [Tatlockia sp.]|nr:hypothetical protein [Tatlockia sp.]